jgi:hypothetical protein
MKNYTPGELVELEHAADLCEVQSVDLEEKAAKYPDGYEKLLSHAKLYALASGALREFCEIKRDWWGDHSPSRVASR